MTAFMLKTLATSAALIMAGCAAPAAGAASAGEWRLAAPLCPDLAEDFRDRGRTWSRADLREDRRDARVVRCPASALVWTPPPGARAARAPQGPDVVVVHIHPDGRYETSDARGRAINVRIVTRLDA